MNTHRIGRTVRHGSRLALLVVLCGALTAAAQAAGPYDGKYSGKRTVETEGDGSICGKTGPFSITVTENQFEYMYYKAMNVVLRPAIAADGTFSARQDYMLQRSSHSARISGRVSGNIMTADVEGMRCRFRLELKK